MTRGQQVQQVRQLLNAMANGYHSMVQDALAVLNQLLSNPDNKVAPEVMDALNSMNWAHKKVGGRLEKLSTVLEAYTLSGEEGYADILTKQDM